MSKRTFLQTISAGVFLLCTVAQVTAIEVVKNPSTVIINAGGKPIVEYRFSDVPFKPYISQLYTPGGVAMLRDSPFDHKHHHSLMFAIGADGVDFWAELPKCGKQVSKKLETGDGSITHQLEWTATNGTPALIEERTIRIHRADGLNATLLTWQSKLQTPKDRGEIKLTGSHYFGLGMRFVTSMDKIGTFTNASGHTGDVVRGDERLALSKWCAYSAPAEGKMVTVAMFDHPANLRHPARMFTMLNPFSYLSATLNLWKEPFILKAGQSLELRYGVAAWDGKADSAEIEKAYQKWLTFNK